MIAKLQKGHQALYNEARSKHKPAETMGVSIRDDSTTQSHVTVSVLWLFMTVPWVDLQCVIVAFPCHTNFLVYSFVSFQFDHTPPRKERVALLVCLYMCVSVGVPFSLCYGMICDYKCNSRYDSLAVVLFQEYEPHLTNDITSKIGKITVCLGLGIDRNLNRIVSIISYRIGKIGKYM